MLYYSLNRKSEPVDFRQATRSGQAPDRGLYFPERIPGTDAELIAGIEGYSKAELGALVMQPFVGDVIPFADLQRIVAEAIDFPFPMELVSPGMYSLELFHGPTLAFKDVGARFMSRCLGYFARQGNSRPTTVLVATSGDTGGAVAHGFLGVEGVEVVILYPSGKVSPVQELQLTTCGKNITALEVKGSFDDCQAMVKDAFADKELSEKLNLTSANSINIARWLSQQLFYFFAWQAWQDKDHPPAVSVPSGNFGNLCAGLVAHARGLPFTHFIAACNVNDAVPVYLETGVFSAGTAVPTISNAMDVGNPSNFVRILELFNSDHANIAALISGTTVTDKETKETIRKVWREFNYTLDPHGAVAYFALEQYLREHPGQKGIFLETAHPVKFPEVVEKETGQALLIPESAKGLFALEKKSVVMEPGFSNLKDFLAARS